VFIQVGLYLQMVFTNEASSDPNEQG